MSAFPVVHTYTLKYHLLNSSGVVLRSFTLENFQGNDGGIDFANIDADNDKIYVVYKVGNQIKTRKSTNAGQSWVTTIQNINLGNNTCNNIDITFGKDDNALHVVWATQDAGSDYKTYYRRLYNDVWGTTEYVTDGSNVGGFPTVSKSTNRVHVSYNTGQSWDPESNLGDAKSRDKYVNTWQTPQNVQSSPQCFRERIHAGSSKVFDFNYQLKPGYYASDLYVKERSINSSTWSSGQLLKSFAEVREIVSAANSVDGKTHIAYEISGGVGYRNYNGSSWISESTIGEGYNSPRIYSVSNDLFTVWGKDWPNGYIQYRQYDAAPLAPSNLTISINSSDETVLTWTANNEPDVRIINGKYNIYRAETDYNGNLLPYQLAATINAVNGSIAVNSWIDGDALKSTVRKLYYKITAVDINQHESLFSNIVWRFGRLGKTTSQNISNSEYELFDNYPNPFNPSTKISYSIKEEGLVTLKVYDILGKEIVTLVNENKPAGIYEAEFNASQLPSGMYIYKIQTGSFSDVKKMLLTK
ncbi:MAG: T9SS type A sorting domain-containing protein [Ignavibacterium sp.]|nr:T9SS type A sorting domain-containing protein [Ignavibacterium sp.]